MCAHSIRDLRQFNEGLTNCNEAVVFHGKQEKNHRVLRAESTYPTSE